MARRPTMQVLGVPELQRRLGGPFLAKGLSGLLRRLTILGERFAKAGVKSDTGALKRSISSQVRPFSARVFTPLKSAKPVEFGRRKGATPPPMEAIRGWWRRHGKPYGHPAALAKAIGRRGIKGRFFMKAALGKLRVILPGEVRRVGPEIEAAWRRSK